MRGSRKLNNSIFQLVLETNASDKRYTSITNGVNYKTIFKSHATSLNFEYNYNGIVNTIVGETLSNGKISQEGLGVSSYRIWQTFVNTSIKTSSGFSIASRLTFINSSRTFSSLKITVYGMLSLVIDLRKVNLQKLNFLRWTFFVKTHPLSTISHPTH